MVRRVIVNLNSHRRTMYDDDGMVYLSLCVSGSLIEAKWFGMVFTAVSRLQNNHEGDAREACGRGLEMFC